MKNILLVSIIICLSASFANSQETESTPDKKEKKVYVKVKDNQEPDVYIDGKKYDYTVVNLLDPDKIESIDVIKNEQALKKYNAPNGVILITSKKASDENTIRIKGTENTSDDPLVIIDGETSSKEDLEKLSPDGIEKIEVFKGEEAATKYNAPNGAIIVTTKK